MAYDANEVAIFREQTVFAKIETTSGTLIFPAGADAILIAAEGMELPNQQPSYTDSPEISNTRGIMDRTPDAYPPGKWGFSTLVRPSGTAGTPPVEHVLMRALCGSYTNNAGTSDVYSPLISGKPTFSLWWKVGHTVFFMRKGTVNSCQLTLTNKGYPIYKWTGECAEIGRAGESHLDAGEAAGQTVLSVAHPEHFSVGGRIWNVTKDDDNSGAGYAITEVSVSGGTITVGTALPVGGWDNNDHIAGFLPTAAVPTSTSCKSKNTVIEFDDAAASLNSLDITITDPTSFDSDEISSTTFPESVYEDDRDVSGTIVKNFKASDTIRFYEAMHVSETTKVEIILGSGAGYRCLWAFPTAKLDIPTVTPEKPMVKLSIGFKALESSGEDSYSVTYY